MIIRRFTAKLPQGAVDVGCIQDQGAREYQEDTAGFSEVRDDGTAERFAAVVADGMGGMASGGFVSDYTVKNLLAANIGSPEELCAAVRRISGEIAAGGSRGGTTIAAVYLLAGGVYFCSVGDSRVYLLHDGILTRLTDDQDYMSVLLERVLDGRTSFPRAETDPERDSLSQFVGSGTLLTPEMNRIPLAVTPGDRLLICSDGVYNALSEDELRQSLALSAGGAAEDIMGRILARGYANQDNFTAVVLQFLPGWGETPAPAQPEDNEAPGIDCAFHTSEGGCNENQDDLFAGGGIYAVADGLGGHKSGAKASRAAVEYLSGQAGADFSPEGVNALLEGANEAVRCSGGLSALAAGFYRDGEFTCGNVGDSRVYYFRSGRVIYQSRDHSVCQAAVELGEISSEEIRGSADRAGLLKALGAEASLDLRQRCEPIKVQRGDAFLLCSDGFWEYIHEREMEAELIKAESSAAWLNSMLKRHLLRSRNCGDNYTAVCGIFTDVRPQELPAEKKRFPAFLVPVGVAAVALIAAALILLLGR